MTIQRIVDANQNEVGVFIPSKDGEEIKKYLPEPFALDTEVASAVQDFSWHQLQESTQSILSGLKAYYARLIMAEEQESAPDETKIYEWDEQRTELSRSERESFNYSFREQMTRHYYQIFTSAKSDSISDQLLFLY